MHLVHLIAGTLAFCHRPALAAQYFLEATVPLEPLSLQQATSPNAQNATKAYSVKEMSQATFKHQNLCHHMKTEPACYDKTGPGKDMAQVVVSSFLEDIHWLNELDWDGNITVLVHDRTLGASHLASDAKRVTNLDVAEQSEAEVKMMNPLRRKPIEFVDIPNKGDEAAAYLSWIIRKYNKLPDTVFFLHGHRCSKHAQFDMAVALPSMTRCFDSAVGYHDLSTYNAVKPTCGDLDYFKRNKIFGHDRNMKDTWTEFFEKELGPMPTQFCVDKNGQFMVSRDRLQQHPVSFYARLFEASKAGKINMEYFWRMLFVPGATQL